MKSHTYICTLALLLITFSLFGQQNHTDSISKEPYTITLKCGKPDLSSVPMLILCEDKSLFLPAKPGASKNNDFFAKIDPNFIRSIEVTKEEEVLSKYNVEAGKSLIIMYLDSDFMDSSPRKTRAKFKHTKQL